MDASLNYEKYAAVELSMLPWCDDPKDKSGDFNGIALKVDMSRLPAHVKITVCDPDEHGPNYIPSKSVDEPYVHQMDSHPTPADPTLNIKASSNSGASEGFMLGCLDSSYILHKEAVAASETWAWTNHVPPTLIDEDDSLSVLWQARPWYGSGNLAGMRVKELQCTAKPVWTIEEEPKFDMRSEEAKAKAKARAEAIAKVKGNVKVKYNERRLSEADDEDQGDVEERKQEQAEIRLGDAFKFASKTVARFNRDCPTKSWKEWALKLKELSADLVLRDEAERLPSLPALIAALGETDETAAYYLWAEVSREAQGFKADVIPPLKPNYRNYLKRLIPALKDYTGEGEARNFQIWPDRDRELWGAELLLYCFDLVSSKKTGDNIFWETSTTDDTVGWLAVRMMKRLLDPRTNHPNLPDEPPYVERGTLTERGTLRGFIASVWRNDVKKEQKGLLVTDEDPLNKAKSLQSDKGDADPDLQNRNGTLEELAVSYGKGVQHGITYVDPKTGMRTPAPVPSDELADLAEKRKATFTEDEKVRFDRLVAKKTALAAARRKATTAERKALAPEGKALAAESKAFARAQKNKRKAKTDVKAAKAADDYELTDEDEFTDEQNAWEAATIKRQREAREASQRVRDREAVAKAAMIAEVKEIVAAGKKARATKLHPDHGGTSDGMQNVNAAADWLLKSIEKEAA